MPCCGALCSHLRSQWVQSQARAHYRLHRWKAARVRHKWVAREMCHQRELNVILRSPYERTLETQFGIRRTVETELAFRTSLYAELPQDDVNPLTRIACPQQIKSAIEECLESETNEDESGAVLSPRRLSERLNENAMAREAIGASDAELAQYLHDERIALFLQNDEFINELRSDQDFMSALQREHEGFPDADDWDEQSSQTFRDRSERKLNLRWSEGPGGVLPPLDDATFKERLSNMGKVSKKKFAQIAKVFSRGRRTVGGGARSLLPNVGGGSGTAGRDLLMSTDSLIDDLDEERHRSASESSGTRNQL